MKYLELRIPPVIVVLIFLLVMYLMNMYLPAFRVNFDKNIACAIALFALGFITALMGVLEFKFSKTTLDPRYPHKTSTLVKSGIFSYSRNPMYLGFLITLLGCAFYLSNTVVFVLLPLFMLYMNRFQIHPEERFMRKNFPEEFEAYCKQVRRWI